MKKQLLSGFICILLLNSCKKNHEPPLPHSPARQLISTVADISGETVSYYLTYDSKDRLVGYRSPEDEYDSKVTYDANDNPVRFEIESPGTRQVFDITYSATGTPLSAIQTLYSPDSTGIPVETHFRYEVGNGKVFRIDILENGGTVYSYLLSYEGNNLTSLTNTAGDLLLSWRHSSKKSPYSSAKFKYLVIPDLFPVLSAENEITETTIVLPEFGAVTLKEDYQYDASGYPVSSVTKDQHGNTVQTTRFHYKE